MTIILNDQPYEVALENNATATDILAMLPLNGTFSRFGGHEFYMELPSTPAFAKERTSQIKAGHVYYWDGWNAFVINYIDWDIAPYEVVHVGEIIDQTIMDVLAHTEDTITLGVESIAPENPSTDALSASYIQAPSNRFE